MTGSLQTCALRPFSPAEDGKINKIMRRGDAAIPRLTYENRERIKSLLNAGLSVPGIAQDIGVCPDTVYKEIARCGVSGQYDPAEAQAMADAARKRQNNLPKKGALFAEDTELARLVSELIRNEGMNVQQVVEWLQNESPERFARLPKSRNTIFAAIDSGLIPGVTRDTLKTRTVRLYCEDLLHLPQWVIRELDLHTGDEFSIEVKTAARGPAIILKMKKKDRD